MHETRAELAELQRLLDASAASAGPHLAGILTADHRLDAAALVDRMQGMKLLSVATVTAAGRPLAGPVDGYLLHGSFHFSSGRSSVRMRHLARRPWVSASHIAGEELAVTVHGRAELYDLDDPARPEQRQAMLDHYLPEQGAAFAEWLDSVDGVGARIVAAKLFVFAA